MATGSLGDSGDRGDGAGVGGGGVESFYAFFVPSGTSDYVTVVRTSSAKHPVYSASVYSSTCSFKSCAEQGHKGSVQTLLFFLSSALVFNDKEIKGHNHVNLRSLNNSNQNGVAAGLLFVVTASGKPS